MAEKNRCKLIFAMPGQGSSGKVPVSELCKKLPVFGDCIESADKILAQELSFSVLSLFETTRANTSLQEQLAVFIYSCALAKQYIAWGAFPDAIISHSLGEFAALVISGAVSFKSMLRFVIKRAKIIDAIDESGAMVHAETDIVNALNIIEPFVDTISLAAVNSLNSVIISGTLKSVKKLEKILDLSSIKHKRLRVPKAAHSCIIDPALEKIALLEFPQITQTATPIFSSVDNITPETIIGSPQWLIKHARKTVRFDKALEKLGAFICNNPSIVVEFGVHRVLAPSGIAAMPDTVWLGASSMVSYIPDKPTEYCFLHGISECVEKLEKAGLIRI